MAGNTTPTPTVQKETRSSKEGLVAGNTTPEKEEPVQTTAEEPEQTSDYKVPEQVTREASQVQVSHKQVTSTTDREQGKVVLSRDEVKSETKFTRPV